MDREKVIEAFDEEKELVWTDDDEYTVGYNNGLEVGKNIALALLKEQEAVKPCIDIDEAKCPICKVKLTRQELLGDDVLFEDFFDYCPHCGRSVKWE